MFTNFKRILMAEADAGASGGNAASAPEPANADVPQAQGDTPELSKEMADLIKSTVAEALTGVKDSIFAEARRTFTQKRTAPKEETPTPAPQPQTLTLDPVKGRALDRALARKGFASKLTESQYQRAEKAFAMEQPEDVDAWVSDYFEGYGAAPQPAAQQQTVQPTQPAKPANERPVSDRGAPPPVKVPLEQADLVTISDSDRAALIREKGPKWYVQQLEKQLKGRQVHR